MFRYGLSADGATFQAVKFEGLHASGKKPADDEQRVGVVVDVETTGLDQRSDEVIEVAARKISFDKSTGNISWIGEAFQALQEPGKPLSDAVKRLTGLADEELKGQAIDWREFDKYISEAVIVIAHNAAFDRPFVDRHSAASRDKIWGCSSFQIDWCRWFPSPKQQFLALCHGYFYDAHRGLNDVDALIKLLGFSLPEGSGTYLLELLENAKRPNYWIYADNSPYETKDVLKKSGYRWNGKAWQKKVLDTQLESEKKFLAEGVYGGKFLGRAEQIRLKDNFKSGTDCRA